MKPQSDAFLEKAQDMLGRAKTMLRAGLNEDAGRAAYLAGFHAAQALIFELEDRVLKTHHGVQTEFSRLIKGNEGYSIEHRVFLGQTYNLKTIADYETGPGSKVTKEKAAEAIAFARSFVTHLTNILDGKTT